MGHRHVDPLERYTVKYGSFSVRAATVGIVRESTRVNASYRNFFKTMDRKIAQIELVPTLEILGSIEGHISHPLNWSDIYLTLKLDSGYGAIKGRLKCTITHFFFG